MIKNLLVVITLMIVLLGCGDKPQSKEILFVCTHGAARSPIAAAYFNQLAEEKNLNYHAVFRGTEPDETLSAGTIAGLSKDGFDINDWKPSKVSPQDMDNAYAIITFDCEVDEQADLSRREKWDGTPAISQDFDKARDAILGHVRELIAALPNE